MAGLPGSLFKVSESAKEPLIQSHSANLDIEEESKEMHEMAGMRQRGQVLSRDNSRDVLDQDSLAFGVSVHETDAPSTNAADYAADQQYCVNKRKCKDAALYVCEGEKDAKIFKHPTGYWSKKAFKIHHHPIYYVVHLIMSLLLMFLAPVETLFFHESSSTVLLLQSSTELLLLSVFAVDIIVKFIWLGPKNFFKHKRTLLITVFLIVMILDVLVVLIRQKSHIRVIKALRPVFFIDSHYLFGVRRVMRQILLCAKPITDVLLLILFFIVFFSLLGYYFFTESDPSFYATFWRTFVSLFITMTTANNPDVMLEVFYEHPISVLFFLTFLVVTFYYLMNVLLAVVYGSYEEEEKKKFKKIFKHKIGALDRAYDILATENGICFEDFLLFMHYFKPTTPKWQVMCIFKALHKDTQSKDQEQPVQYLSREEFFNLHDVRALKWKQDCLQPYIQQRCALAVHKFCNIMVKSKPFNVIINLVVLFNLLFLLIYTIVTSGLSRNPEESLQNIYILPVSYTFISIYMIEIILRIIGLGPLLYFKKKRNILDFSLILLSLICLLLETEADYVFLASVRPLKLIRVLRLKRRYRDITNTTIVLIPRLINVALLLMVVYYFFAIIGIECLRGVVHEGCCNKSWYGVGSSFSGAYISNTTDNFPASSDVYYILNFNNITNSYVTLFVLMVVNNWYIIMEGFASEVKAGWLVRVYFMSFFIVMLVILQVVISFIVDEFKFKVLDTAKERICPQHGKTFEHCRCKRYRKKVVEVTFLPADVEEIEALTLPKHRFDFNSLIRKFRQINLHQEEDMKFIGRRLKTNDDVKLKIFQSEIQEWLKEYTDMKTNTSEQSHSPYNAFPGQKSNFEKAKSIARQCILYFVDWVIE